MKKQLFIGALALAGLVGVAQNKVVKKRTKHVNSETTKSSASIASLPASNYYTFTTFTAPYTNITGSVVTAGLKWDEAIFTIPLGFNFKLYNAQNDTISFQGASLFSFGDVLNDPIITACGPMWEDLCDRAFDTNADSDGDPGGISPITYTTVGTPGSRICKVEVNNAGFWADYDANSSSNNFVNFQTWFYETTNMIEYRFGNCSVPVPADCFVDPNGFACSLFENFDGTNNPVNSNSLNGPFANPSMVGMAATYTDIVTGTMQSGRVYQFARTTVTGIKSVANVGNLSLYPNPAKDKLFISNISAELNDANIEFYDVAGKLIHSEKIANEINLSGFNKGIYLVKIKTQNNQSAFINKIVITD